MDGLEIRSGWPRSVRVVGGEDDADRVYSTLHSSAISRFRGFHWLGLIISFARRQEGDFTLKKYAQALASDVMYGDKAYTWEVNPQFEEGHPHFRPFEWKRVEELNILVPDDLHQDFVLDPTEAKTKYMCEPPPQEGAFFELPHKVAEAQDPTLPPIVFTKSVREVEIPAPSDGSELSFTVIKRFVRIDVDQLPPRRPDSNYFLHGDPGLNNDAFALCLCHTVPEAKTVMDADGHERELKKVVVDFVLAWEPKANTPVDVINVNEVILKVARYYSVRHVTFDKWNSASSVQMLLNVGIFAEDLSFSNPMQLGMYRNLKLLVYNDMLVMPELPEVVKELQYLKLVNNKIDHDVYGKDRADAVAAAAWLATSRPLSKLAQLVQETMGKIYNDGPGSTYATVWMPVN